MKKGGGHVLTGGADADVFEFRYASSSKVDDAIITDFDINQDSVIVMGQTIDMSSLPSGFVLTDTGADMRLTYGDDDFIVFQGVSF